MVPADICCGVEFGGGRAVLLRWPELCLTKHRAPLGCTTNAGSLSPNMLGPLHRPGLRVRWAGLPEPCPSNVRAELKLLRTWIIRALFLVSGRWLVKVWQQSFLIRQNLFPFMVSAFDDVLRKACLIPLLCNYAPAIISTFMIGVFKHMQGEGSHMSCKLLSHVQVAVHQEASFRELGGWHKLPH